VAEAGDEGTNGGNAAGGNAAGGTTDGAGPASPAQGRSATALAGARARTRRRVSELEDRREASPLIDAGFRLGETNRAVGGVVLAGAVAFRLFVFLVPLGFTYVVALGVYGDYSSPSEAASAGGLGGLAANVVQDASAASGGFQWTAVLTGTAATLWAGYGLARVLRIVHALSWRCPLRAPRHPVLLPLWPVAVTVVAMALTRLLKAARDHLGAVGTGVTIAGLVAFGALWLVVSRHLPRDERAGWLDLLPGAAMVGIGTQVLHLATIWYFAARIDGLSDRYGAMGTALGVLSWAYLVGWMCSMSGVLNAVVFEVRGRGADRGEVAAPDRG